jgi:hypothetical protein
MKRRLIRVVMRALPADEQARMAANLVAWLYADLPPAARREKAAQVGPRLMAMIRQGRFGLRLLVYTHLLRLPGLRRLDPWVVASAGPPGGQPEWQAPPRPGEQPAGPVSPRLG